jgi:kynureninase
MTLPAPLALARSRDAADPLAAFRSAFARPTAADGSPAIYLCGHSLGPMPLAARDRVVEELDDWARLAVTGHHAARRPWIHYAERAGGGFARLAGAQPADVVAMNSLTTNLHLLLASFYRPAAVRTRVLIEAGAFSSDRHAIAAQIAWHGLDPDQELLEIASREPGGVLGEDDVEAAILAAGDRLALVLWPGVQYLTGQAFDCARIARAAHAVGALCGFDHAHAIGNLPLALELDDADFAVWCSYKYLNAGPGAIGGAFVHPRHSVGGGTFRLAGWWGHDPASRFAMRPGFVPAAGAAGWAVSNPPILSAAPLLASLSIFDAAGITALRRKSVELTAFLEALLAPHVGRALEQTTPSAPSRRGCQLSLRLRGGRVASHAVLARLEAEGMVLDFREPDVLRVALAPLYNGFEDAWRFADALGRALREIGE